MSGLQQIPKISVPIGIIGCIGGIFIHLVIGSLYQWGIVSIYITSYHHYSDNSVTLESTSIAFPLMAFCIGITMRLGLYLSEVVHPLFVSILGQIFCALTVLISSYISDIWLFIVFYGIIFGFFAGLNFMVPIYQCNKYLVGKKMYVNGLILIGTGAGPVVFGQFSYNFLNPDKIPPIGGYYYGTDELQSIAMKVPTLLKWLSLLYLCVGLLGTLLLAPVYIHNKKVEKLQQKAKQEEKNKQNTKRQEIQQIDSSKENATSVKVLNENKSVKIYFPNLEDMNQNESKTALVETNSNIKSVNQLKKIRSKKLEPIQQKGTKNQPQLQVAESIFIAMKSGVFWTTIALFFSSACGSYLLNGNYKTYVKQTIHDDNFLTIIGVVGSVGNGCSRFFWSLFYSKTGFKTVWLTIVGLEIVIFSTIRYTTSLQSAYIFEVFLANCCLGGYLVMTPTVLTNIYGQRTGSNIYGVYWCNFAFTNFLGYVYVEYLTKKIGFDNVIYICLGMVVIVCPFIILSKFQGPWGNPTHQVQFCVGRQLAKVNDQKTQVQSPAQQSPNEPQNINKK